MKNAIRIGTVIAALVLGAIGPASAGEMDAPVASSPAQPRAQDTVSPAAPAQVDAAAVLQRMADLEKEVQRLRDELQAVKAAPAGTAALRPAVYTPEDAQTGAAPAVAQTPAATPAPTKPDPLAGLASVLGGATVTGLVDGYYSYNFNKPELGFGVPVISTVPGNFTTLRLFDARNNQFALNLIELGLVKTPDADNRLGYKVIFGFGDAMNVVNSSNDFLGFAQYLKEGYLSYLAPIGKGLQIDFGKFVTPNGAEVIESNANWNYSRSILFNYAIPFYHYGLRLQYTFNPKFSLTGYVANGWNDIVHDVSNGYHNSGKTGGLTFAWNATKKLTVTENWMGGPGAVQFDGGQWRNLFDTVVAYNWTPKLSLQLNGDYGRVEAPFPFKPVDWWGAAGYAKYQFNPKYAFALRYEYYNDPQGYTTGFFDANGDGPHFQEVTATLERKIATHLITRLEYRHDDSNQTLFPKGRAGNPFVTGQNTLAVGMMFVLEPSEAPK